LIDGPARQQENPYKDAVLRPPDAEVRFVGDQSIRWQLVEHLEAVIDWRLQNRDHCVMDDVSDDLPVFR
jgi:hypothetical protein